MVTSVCQAICIYPSFMHMICAVYIAVDPLSCSFVWCLYLVFTSLLSDLCFCPSSSSCRWDLGIPSCFFTAALPWLSRACGKLSWRLHQDCCTAWDRPRIVSHWRVLVYACWCLRVLGCIVENRWKICTSHLWKVGLLCFVVGLLYLSLFHSGGRTTAHTWAKHW